MYIRLLNIGFLGMYVIKIIIQFLQNVYRYTYIILKMFFKHKIFDLFFTA